MNDCGTFRDFHLLFNSVSEILEPRDGGNSKIWPLREMKLRDRSCVLEYKLKMNEIGLAMITN